MGGIRAQCATIIVHGQDNLRLASSAQPDRSISHGFTLGNPSTSPGQGLHVSLDHRCQSADHPHRPRPLQRVKPFSLPKPSAVLYPVHAQFDHLHSSKMRRAAGFTWLQAFTRAADRLVQRHAEACSLQKPARTVQCCATGAHDCFSISSCGCRVFTVQLHVEPLSGGWACRIGPRSARWPHIALLPDCPPRATLETEEFHDAVHRHHCRPETY